MAKLTQRELIKTTSAARDLLYRLSETISEFFVKRGRSQIDDASVTIAIAAVVEQLLMLGLLVTTNRVDVEEMLVQSIKISIANRTDEELREFPAQLAAMTAAALKGPGLPS